ncbi:MAG: ATP-binding cassette domain-containing protein [Oscillospiraceae bacterium]|nr:ATP-binding cassette domain-containing protein [Oscillospiraceae bacterium]
MPNDKRLIRATWRIMEQLLEVEDLTEALSGSLDVIVRELNSEAGAIWFLDEKSDRLFPLFQNGPADISDISVENGIGIEGMVTKTGRSVHIEDTAVDPRFDGSVFDDSGLSTRTMLCVPLVAEQNVLGCVQVINRNDGAGFDDEDLKICERMAAIAAMTVEEKGLLIHPEEEKEVLIRLKNVIKDFPSGDSTLRVLKGINLDIFKGEFVVVLGESGCGKSTMVNIIGGMDCMTEGTLLVEDRDFSHPTDDELTRYRREDIGFVFQSYNLMPNLTALENVQFIAEIAKNPMRAEDAIEKVGLSDRANNYPSMLSGGQQQRVSIARAIVKNPKVIFADEPTAALDYQTSIEVLGVFEDIVRTQDTTVVMITHNPEIARMADRVVKIRSGLVFSIRNNPHPAHASELVW